MDCGIWCSKHNYAVTSSACPDCHNEQQDNHYKRLYDIEHRRRVAAEALYELQTEYYLKINDYDNGQLSEMEYKISKAFKKWQSIIKEAGDDNR